MLSNRIIFASLLLLSGGTATVRSAEIDYRASVTANASTDDFAPYMIGSWNYGKVTGASGIWHDGFFAKRMDYSSRFSWGAGVEYLLGYGSAAEYRHYFGDSHWGEEGNRQAPARIQQLYAEMKYRSLFLRVGMKEEPSIGIVDDDLSSGDLTLSNNARPIPGLSAGFTEFQNIPLTNGWVQINGSIMYGPFTDSRFRRDTFNHWTGLLCDDTWFTYKQCTFRTKPSEPFSVTVGLQAGAIFAGNAKQYYKGNIETEYRRGFRFKDAFNMLFPHQGNGENFYTGNTTGSWVLRARYRFRNDSEAAFYFEGPWEDGSGIGRQNGWDGLWGLQFNFPAPGIISKAVVEYFDFTHQSGPLLWSEVDNPGTTITSGVSGNDNYYNNSLYGTYSNYGMSIGSPFVVSPLYNTNGRPEYLHNRARGFHAAVMGRLAGSMEYKAMVSYQKAGGYGSNPAIHRLHDTSAMLQIGWTPTAIPALTVKGQIAFDAGNLRGNNLGALVGVTYSGSFDIRR